MAEATVKIKIEDEIIMSVAEEMDPSTPLMAR